jgi:hypothetical protein
MISIDLKNDYKSLNFFKNIMEQQNLGYWRGYCREDVPEIFIDGKMLQRGSLARGLSQREISIMPDSTLVELTTSYQEGDIYLGEPLLSGRDDYSSLWLRLV